MLLILSHLSSSRTGCFCGCDTSSLELPTNLPALLHHVSAHICLLLSLLRTDAVAHPGGQALNGWDQQDTLQKKPSRPFQTCQGKLSSILKVFEKSKTAFHGQGKKQGRGRPGGGKNGGGLWRGGTQSWLSGNEDLGEEEDDWVGAVPRGPCPGLQMWYSSLRLSDGNWPGRQAPSL